MDRLRDRQQELSSPGGVLGTLADRLSRHNTPMQATRSLPTDRSDFTPTSGQSQSGVAAAALQHASSLAAERADLQRQLSRAEADIERLTRSMDQMRRGHEAQIAAVNRERENFTTALEQHHFYELEGLRLQVTGEFNINQQLRRELAAVHGECENLRNEVKRKPNLVTAEDIAPVIAGLEMEALRAPEADDAIRKELRRKLQLKWHPDKCSASELAKCVMQELQQCADWKS